MTCLLPISQASVWRQLWTRFLEFEQGLCYWISACYGASNFPSLGLSFLTYNSRRFDWIGVLGLWNPRKSTDGVQMSKESPRICMQKILCLWLKGPLDFSIFKGTHYHSKFQHHLPAKILSRSQSLRFYVLILVFVLHTSLEPSFTENDKEHRGHLWQRED